MDAVKEMEELIAHRDAEWAKAIARRMPKQIRKINQAASTLPDEEQEVAAEFLRTLIDATVAWHDSPDELLRRWQHEKKLKIFGDSLLTFSDKCALLGLSYGEMKAKATAKYKALPNTITREIRAIHGEGVLLERQKNERG
jgi:hypothetical protein